MKRINVLFLSREDVTEVDLNLEEVITIIEEVLAEHGKGDVMMPEKQHIFLSGFSLHSMPGYVAKGGALGTKWLTYCPGARKMGLDSHQGFVIINEAKRGMPVAIIDASWITFARTAAVAAVGAKHLAKSGARRLGIVGVGALARFMLPLMKEAVPTLEIACIHARREAALKKFLREMRGKVEMEMQPAKTVAAAVQGADVVITATAVLKEPIVKEVWFSRGAYAAPQEGNSAWEPEAILRADKLVVDNWQSVRGFFARAGGFSGELPRLYAELGEVVAGKKPGREDDEERIVNISVGMGTEDVALGRAIYRRARRLKIGTHLYL